MNLKSIPLLFLLACVSVVLGHRAHAQDPTVVDSAHYKVEFETDQVRVIRIKYGPGEESVMHEHPAGLVVFLTDAEGLMTFPDGTTREMSWKAGFTAPVEAETHKPKNTGDKAFELIQVEFKEDGGSSGEY